MTASRLVLVAVLLSCVAPLAACGQASAGIPERFPARSAFDLGACTRCGAVESVVSRPLHMRGGAVYDVTIRMDHGGRRVLTFDRPPGLRAGDKIRISGDALERA